MTRIPRLPILRAAAVAAVASLVPVLTPGMGQTTAGSTGAKPGFTFPYRKDNVLVARVSGEDGRALSLSIYEVKGFRIETYNPDGTPNLIGEAPNCTFNVNTTNASSSGPLTITQAGGGFSLSGEGFNWNHAAQRLQLSNRVHAVFRLNAAPSLTSPSRTPK
ncbi:MAG: hypothetical protein JNL10_20655 [Verrucomicrobiales bacterium]|nr:hypothetical protein [Verrucomicrobiales bacterium]